MSDKEKLGLLILILVGVFVAAGLFILSNNLAVLSPKGAIAAKQSHLIITATLLMLVVVVPVYIMTFTIAWKYREGNVKAEYKPEWDHNRALESAWWAIPGVIILILSVITWHSSNQLDPFKKLQSSTKPLTVQVVALQWKWLFIYPQQSVASLNFLQLPVATPINFEITADAPMNSLWIPELGGQIYAMSGMSTNLHLLADSAGDYQGSSANVSGQGFASMRFITRVSSAADFNQWLSQVHQSSNILSLSTYNRLAQPGTSGPVFYSSSQAGLYDQILNKYLGPANIALDGHQYSIPAGAR